MRATIKDTYSTDIDVESYVPDDPHDDGQWVSLLVGPADEEGEESFDVLVCTPRWLGRVVADKGPQLGRHRLVVDPFDLPAAIAFLTAHVESLEAPDWPALAQLVARVGRWEFEDYQE